MMTFGAGRDIIKRFEENNALWKDHFVYPNGMHGDTFLFPERVFQNPHNVDLFATRIYSNWDDYPNPDAVVGVGIGGILLANSVSRWHNGRKAVYMNKDNTSLGRGFMLRHDDKVIVVGDVMTTGSEVKKAADYLMSKGAQVIGISVVVDCSSNLVKMNLKYMFRPLAQIQVQVWSPEECVLCKEGKPLTDVDKLAWEW